MPPRKRKPPAGANPGPKAKPKASTKPKPKDEDDDIVVLCYPVGLMSAVPGSRRVNCDTCRQMVWISPATEAHLAGKTFRVLCDECAAKEAEGDDDVKVMPVAEGQIDEMLAALPGMTRTDILKNFPVRNPGKRRAALDEILREAIRRRRTKN